MKNPTGFLVAIVGIVALGVFLSLTVIVLGVDAVIASEETGGASVLSALLAENGQTVLVATVGSIATIAGGALGYQMGLAVPSEAEQLPGAKPVATAKQEPDEEFWEE
jgi:membrane protein YqaA with SNARE-associated domain